MNISLIEEIKRENPQIKVVVASKYIDSDHIRAFYHLGQKCFGENRADELASKAEELQDSKDIDFHFIGHLQSNKADLVLPYISTLHSLDSIKLAALIERKRATPLDCYVELKMSDNPNKHGVPLDQLDSFLKTISEFNKVNVVGFMAMSEPDMSDLEKRALFEEVVALAKDYGYSKTSMGMSDDYPLAIEAGTTCIRLGRILFEKEECKAIYQSYFKE